MAEVTIPNLDSRLYGLRYLQSYQLQLRLAGQTDISFSDQLKFLLILQAHANQYKSQLGQDVMALAMSDFKRGGYFVEVGAHHGEHLSNSWYLENGFDWNGLLVECNPRNFASLETRRAVLVKKAAWHTTGEMLSFHATVDSALSSLADVQQFDLHDRTNFDSLTVETMRLDDILEGNQAPKQIDYLSIDVEGAELDVLDGLSPSKWDIQVANLEHNLDNEKVAKFDKRMADYGLVRVLDTISDFDAYYAKPECLEIFRATWMSHL